MDDVTEAPVSQQYLIVSNLDASLSNIETKVALYCGFAQFSRDIKIVTLWTDAAYSGIAWIGFSKGEEAQAAFLKMSGFVVLGSPIHVRMAAENPPFFAFMSRKRRRDISLVRNYVPSHTPTTALLLVGAPLFWAETVLQKCPGYQSCTSCGRESVPAVLVKFTDCGKAEVAYRVVAGARPLGYKIGLYFATVRSALRER